MALRLAEKYPRFHGLRQLFGDGEAVDYETLEQRVREDPHLVGLVNSISVRTERKGGSDIVGIRSTSSAEQLAIDTANYTADEFVAYNISERNSQIREAVRFIKARIQDTEQELSSAERKLEEFKRDHASAVGLEVVTSRSLTEEIDRLGSSIADLEGVIEQLQKVTKSKIDEYFAFFPVSAQVEDALVAQLEQQLVQLLVRVNELRSEQRNLLAYRTAASREVRENILATEELEKRVRDVLGVLLQRYVAIHEDLVQDRRRLVERQRELHNVPEVNRQLESLQREVTIKTEALGLFQRRLQDAEIQKAGEVKEVTIVETATSASTLPQPSRVFKGLIGLFIGAILGGVFAVILESLDTSIGTIEDVEEYVKIPVLGVIPHLDSETVKQNMLVDQMGSDVTRADIEQISVLCTHFTPTEPISEGFRSMRAHLDVLLKRNGWKTLMLTSSVLQEGKTNTACNLSVVFAQSGQRTLLIDADLRRPRVNKVFGLSDSPGLSEVLLGVNDWQNAARSIDDLILGRFGLKNSHMTPGLEYLFVLTSGRKVDNPAELLNLEKFSQTLSEMRDHYDIVIVDTAPVLPVADSTQLGPGMDATVLSYQIGRIGREVVNRSKARLQAVGANVVGLVMNDIGAEIYHGRDYEYFGYKYRYDESLPSPTTSGFVTRMARGLSGLVRRERGSSTPSGIFQKSPPKPSDRSQRAKAKAGTESADQELQDIMNLTSEEDR